MSPAHLFNHLWQSTLFSVAAWLLTLALRKNRAPVRYWLWFVASCKFLIPFSLLVMIGSQFDWYRDQPVRRPLSSIWLPSVMDQIGDPFASPAQASLLLKRSQVPGDSPAVLLCLWACGFSIVVFSWARQWRQVRTTLRAASPLNLELPIRVMSSPGRLEPGVFGILRPVLLVPEGITNHLTIRQWETILTHELCHVRRCDNLTAAIHMAVEAVFWFHPLVWWMGKRLADERERACDEEVLLTAADPQDYAEGILNVCKLYIESPLACAAGITGSNLKKRIQAIMTERVAGDLTFGKKLALAIAGMAALAVPFVLGVINAPPIQAQSQFSAQSGAATTTKFEVASIKPDIGGLPGTDIRLSPGGLNIRNYTTRLLIETAYHIQSFQISGAPGWINSDRYDIAAKAQGNPTSEQVVGPMLQALLEDRFKLRLHRETKELPVYALTVTKNGLRLQKSSCALFDFNNPPPPPRPGEKLPYVCGSVREGGNPLNWTLDALGMNMSELARNLSLRLDRTVIDRTGINGTFDVHLEYARELPAGAPGTPGDPASTVDTAASPIFTALQERLGLKLESGRGPVEMLVIDHLEKPSEN